MAELSIALTTPLGEGAFILKSMTMVDELSRPFEISLDLMRTKFDVDFDKMLGATVTVELTLTNGRKRYFQGIVSQFAVVGATGRFALYRAVLRPWLWFLTRTSDCRIFNNKTVPQIVKQIFSDFGFSNYQDSTTATYEVREYCVQYRESSFDFISRLLEEEGIYYYFDHTAGAHSLVLCDSISAHVTPVGCDPIDYRAQDESLSLETEGISEWLETREVETGAYALTDYDFEKPNVALKVTSSAPASHTHAKFEAFDYPGRYLTTKVGETYAKIRRQEVQLPYCRYRGHGNPSNLGCGDLFKLAEHPRANQNKEYLVTGAQHVLESSEFELGSISEQPTFRLATDIQAIDSTAPFRPPRLTPKSLVRGPQTAVVVGPSDAEIHTDKYGRVKLKFHWDRYTKADGSDVCWVRVSSTWAGKNWGQIFIPRIGQEVIVDFLEGDPDKPIVTGRVYNADQMPPYTLPDDMTKSTMKSRSTTKGDDKTFNELRFDDKKDKEEIYFHAERDFNRVVENNDTLKVGFEKKDEGNQKIEIHNNQTVTIGNANSKDGSQTLTIWKNRTTTIEKGDETLTIKTGSRTQTIDKGDDKLSIVTGKRTTDIEGDETLTVKTGNRTTTINTGNDNLTISTGNHTIKISAGAQSTEAAQKILLKVGGNSITIDQSGISIKGIQVKVEGSATLDAKSPLTTVKGTGILTLHGALTKIN